MTIYCKNYKDLVEVQDKLIELMKDYNLNLTGIKLRVGGTTHGWEIDYPKNEEVLLEQKGNDGC